MEPLTKEIVARRHSFLRLLPVLLVVLGSPAIDARTVDVRLTLPVRARLDLTNKSTMIVAPFVVVRQEGEGRLQGSNIDVQEEFERYLNKILRRETDLKVLEPAQAPLDSWLGPPLAF